MSRFGKLTGTSLRLVLLIGLVIVSVIPVMGIRAEWPGAALGGSFPASQ